MESLICYKKLPLWNHDSIPQGFKNQHNTKAGTWAKLTILKGELHFSMLKQSGEVLSEHIFTIDNQPTFIEPQAWHKIVSASPDIECQLSFYCEPHDYFSKKYQLAAVHSEVIAALPHLKQGQALDIGCGSGRNTLFLSQNGFKVDAWDLNENSILKLNDISQAEQMENIQTQIRDLNQNSNIQGHYDFICCTVVMMFLQPATIPQLIKSMQQATLPLGFNLIVCAMDTVEHPAQSDFAFTFKTDELRDYYKDWKIIKYNENPGQLHRLDANGNPIKQQFATLLAQKI